MSSAAEQKSAASRFVRRRALPATRLPQQREGRRGSALVSVLLHLLLIILLVTPWTVLHTGHVDERPQGAGGLGPAGGGGGGRRGTGGAHELLHYVKLAPPSTPVVAVAKPVVKPPPTPKPIVPPPVVKPPEPPPKVDPAPVTKVAEAPPKPADATAPMPGTGGGTGSDGSAGNGPGRGGGVGSGEGTGRGSGTGPGTGGGIQADYPPTPTEMFIPPLPMPDKVRGFHLIAEYDVDSTGKVVDFKFTPTRDGGYNKRLDEVLKSFKFRPGTKPDGTPIRMKAQIIYDF